MPTENIKTHDVKKNSDASIQPKFTSIYEKHHQKYCSYGWKSQNISDVPRGKSSGPSSFYSSLLYSVF